ncbi:hypothetical protein ACFCQI_01820 [Rhodanobacter sp. FW102-FHT14D06]|uniref:Uncharacterized protein n=2 Tax=unclassified Rhodanobacter TaxID=2621553 RepID=A0AB74UWR2_9GAMM
MTQKFTAEEVRKIATNLDELVAPITLEENIVLNRAAAALRAYADTLSKPADSGRVGDEMVERACLAYIAADLHLLAGAVDLMREPMRVALSAALAAQDEVKPERCTACGRAADAVCDGLDDNGLGCTNALAAQGQGEAVATLAQMADDLQAIIDGERPRLNKTEMRDYVLDLRTVQGKAGGYAPLSPAGVPDGCIPVPRSLVERWANVDAFNAPVGAAMELKVIAVQQPTQPEGE